MIIVNYVFIVVLDNEQNTFRASPSLTWASWSHADDVRLSLFTTMSTITWHYVLKFIITGDASVGKSSLLVRLTDQRFLSNPDPTLGVEFGSKLISIPEDDKIVKLQCWDTAGTESFRSITRSYYRGAAGCLLVYDVTNRKSMSLMHQSTAIIHWSDTSRLRECEVMARGCTKACWSSSHMHPCRQQDWSLWLWRLWVFLSIRVGHWIWDFTLAPLKPRQVTTEEGAEFARQEGLLFVEASAKSGHNVELAFVEAAKDILTKIKNNVFDDSRVCSIFYICLFNTSLLSVSWHKNIRLHKSE